MFQFIDHPIRGIIHIGAHQAEEHSLYLLNNIEHVLWIECNNEYEDIIIQKIQGNKNHKVIIQCIANIAQTQVFNISNNGQSSSFLDFNFHKYLYPNIKYTKQKIVKTLRMIDIINLYNINLNNYNAINIDVQGYELETIKSFDDTIKNFDYIYTEVFLESLYHNCPLINEIDNYLLKYNFTRKYTKLYNKHWGEALYTKL